MVLLKKKNWHNLFFGTFINRTLVCCFIALIFIIGADRPVSAQNKIIRKINLLIHPFLYESEKSPDPKLKQDIYTIYYNYEKLLNSRIYNAVSDMKEDEALILYWGEQGGTAAQNLADIAHKKLGDRFIVIDNERVYPTKNRFWEMRDQKFMNEVLNEIRNSLINRGQDFNADNLDNALSDMAVAISIKEQLKNLGYNFNPETIEVYGWGECFEGCVAKEAAMIGKYLGLSRPVEVQYDMTIPCALMLIESARFIERIVLAENIILYLFMSADNVPFGIFFDSLYSLSDPLRTISIPLNSKSFEVYSQISLPLQGMPFSFDMTRVWPNPSPKARAIKTNVEATDNVLTVPVNRDGVIPVYIFGRNLNMDEFRRVLVTAAAGEKKKSGWADNILEKLFN